MKYKVTASQDVVVLAYFHEESNERDTLMWVPVTHNKPVDGLGKILGIDPRCVKNPSPATITAREFEYVPIEAAGDNYYKEHFGLFKIEKSAIPD